MIPVPIRYRLQDYKMNTNKQNTTETCVNEVKYIVSTILPMSIGKLDSTFDIDFTNND